MIVIVSSRETNSSGKNRKNSKMVPESWTYDPDNLGHQMLRYLGEKPEELCQIDAQTGVEETRGSVRTRGIKFAMHMTEVGVKMGDLVLVCSHNHNDAYLPLMGSMLIGAVYNAVDMRMSKMEHVHMMKIVRPKILFVDESMADEYRDIIETCEMKTDMFIFGGVNNKKYKNVREFYDNNYDVNTFVPPVFDSAKQTAVVVCSSGSTGLPKGSCHTHRSVARQLKCLALIYKGLKIIQFAANYWVTGVLVALFGLTVESSRINAPPFTTDLFYEYLEKYKFETLSMTPASTNLVLKDPRFKTADFSSIKKVAGTGAPMDFDDQKMLESKISGPLINSYGMSEAMGSVSYLLPDTVYGSIGKILPYITAKIVDPETKEDIKEVNEPGEMCLKSEYFMTHYINDPQATAETINSEGWLLTGDLARIDENGFVFILDRLKEVIKCKGYSIHPPQVEMVINAIPGVLESAIVGVPHKEMNQMPVAFVKRRPGATVTAGEIKRAVKESFGFYTELDGGVVFVESFPMTPSGKFKRKDLKEIYKTAKVEHE